MPTASTLIWISAKPLLKLVITTAFGYFLTKADLFGAVAARGAGQVLLNIFLPSLLFSKIVPGFTVQNIVALGPLILVACIYQLYGLIIAWLVRGTFWVPRRFHNGILAAGVWSNWGDLPTAVIMTMTASAPFSPGDSDVAVAYLSAFILVFFVTLFPLGGHNLIAKDYADGAMPVDADDDDVPESPITRIRRNWQGVCSAIQRRRGGAPSSDIEGDTEMKDDKVFDEKDTKIVSPQPRHVSFNPSEPTAYGGQSTRPPTSAPVSPAPTVVDGITTTLSRTLPTHRAPTPPPAITPPKPTGLKRAFQLIRTFLSALASPPTITMAVAFLVALVPTLKALFITPAPDSNIHIGAAPDGLPPLSIILDTATFIGGASIPLGLICLGSALARLQAPKPISRAPLGAIAAFSILKMVIGPIFGVLLVEGLTHHAGLIDPNDKVLRFVCIYFAGVPTATTQVYLTQIYSPDGSASHISAFLIPQYALMFVTMTALSAYALNILF
ncbi:auxin efflux carrier [Ceratobasidium sp. AG-I]|nr:auxin efflux carrier [Ceratobasidium sp. AG-I]